MRTCSSNSITAPTCKNPQINTYSWLLLHLCITFLDVLEGIGSFGHDNNNQAAMTADKSNSCKEQGIKIMTGKIQHQLR